MRQKYLDIRVAEKRDGRTLSRENAVERDGSSSAKGSRRETRPLCPSSCVSSEGEQGLRCSNSPEGGTTSMVLAGCPRCLMYVMLSEDDPKCPKCKSTVLLDFLHDNASAKAARKS
ncbi:hypothetical protein KSP40_PGU008429 [Platanthera guangdongensis]|uniref:GIR1-like zinc ribbon domain-containing protein n=1 Tax=Platanthera guangdongensis TaxID=2320717 RepID=A0ABR2N1C1_9ASPA